MSNNLFIACNVATLAIGLVQLSRSGKLEWKDFARITVAAQVILFGIAMYFATPMNEDSSALAAALEQEIQGVSIEKLALMTLWVIWEHIVHTTAVPVAALYLLSKAKESKGRAVVAWQLTHFPFLTEARHVRAF